MASASPPMGRRERSKQEKLDRITAAASELFAAKGIDDVTTQQIADKADIGTGTLFLYAKTKGELLLLVQNTHYAAALTQGHAAATQTPGILDALLSIIGPIVACNRVQVVNGRTYLKEMLFGDPDEPHHAEALSIVSRTEAVYSDIVQRDETISAERAAALARTISSITYLTMASAANPEVTPAAILSSIRAQIAAILPHS